MARFFLSAERWKSGELPESEARHAAQVLRLAAGARVTVFDGTGRAAEAEIAECGKRKVVVNTLREWREERVRPAIHLIVALIKNERFDWLVQKATELGVASIQPVAARRSVVKVAADDREKRWAKWRQGAVEAAKQCGHRILPDIHLVKFAGEAFAAAEPGLKGIPCVTGDRKTLREFFVGQPGAVTLAIGPEGDWSAEEMESAVAHGFTALDLGRHVLRSETAAVHVASVAAHVFHDGVGGKR
jgi:16S rRNA (uracil1498-N3)-methyltransferase